MLKIQLCHHMNKLHFKIYSSKYLYYFYLYLFHYITLFVIKKCSLGKNKRLLSKAFQILVKSLLNGSVQTSIQYKMQFAKGNMSKSSPLLNFKMVTFS